MLDSGDLMSGREVEAFEEELAAYFGKRHAVCVSSGTAALESAFVVAHEGDRIHHFGFIALLSAAKAANRRYGVSIGSGTMTDLLGVDVDPGGRVHDCAHRFDKMAAHADLSCFSFNQNKFIACCGGAVLTDDHGAAVLMRQYRNHGRHGRKVLAPGRHHRMPEINAALGRSQLRRIDEIMARRKQVAQWYDSVTCQELAPTRDSWFLYPVENRIDLAEQHRSMADFRLGGNVRRDDYSTALLPIWPLMTREDCEAVCSL